MVNTKHTYEDEIGQLATLQQDRRTAIKFQNQMDNQVQAFARTKLGYDPFGPESDRESVRKQAITLLNLIDDDASPREILRKFYTLTPASLNQIVSVYRNVSNTREPWDIFRANIEGQMEDVAETLPVYPWVKSVRGFSSLGLAVIVGEVGDLGLNRRRPAGVWKRLGYGVEADGYRQGRLPPGLSKEDQKDAWVGRGYSPRRRAEAWAFLDNILLRAQYQKGIALGPYGNYYLWKKGEYLERYADEKGGKGHADKAARRYMSKMFLRDLWREWCRVVPA